MLNNNYVIKKSQLLKGYALFKSNNIFKLLLKRILSSLVVLFLMITFIFFLLRISPGNPSQKFISPDLSPALAEKVRDSFDLNNSLFIQYKSFILNLVQGDLGISYTYRIPVTTVLKPYLKFTIFFAVSSFIIQIGFAFLLALYSIKKINGFLDKTLSKATLFVFSIPSFVILFKPYPKG
ncbi:MAG: ABC transporter permease [Ignavibacteriaceae bacterium]